MSTMNEVKYPISGMPQRRLLHVQKGIWLNPDANGAFDYLAKIFVYFNGSILVTDAWASDTAGRLNELCEHCPSNPVVETDIQFTHDLVQRYMEAFSFSSAFGNYLTNCK